MDRHGSALRRSIRPVAATIPRRIGPRHVTEPWLADPHGLARSKETLESWSARGEPLYPECPLPRLWRLG